MIKNVYTFAHWYVKASFRNYTACQIVLGVLLLLLCISVTYFGIWQCWRLFRVIHSQLGSWKEEYVFVMKVVRQCINHMTAASINRESGESKIGFVRSVSKGVTIKKVKEDPKWLLRKRSGSTGDGSEIRASQVCSNSARSEWQLFRKWMCSLAFISEHTSPLGLKLRRVMLDFW